jgi:hypothetical protein
MSCIKTGCVAYLAQYNEWVYGDAHEFPHRTLVIRAVAKIRNPHELVEFGNVRHFTVSRMAEWFDRPTRRGETSTIIACDLGWSNHGYEGIPEPLIVLTPKLVPQEAQEEEAWVTIRPDTNRDVL